MKILVVGEQLNRISATRLTAMQAWAEKNAIEIEFVTAEDCEQIKGEEYNFAIFNEMLDADINPIYKEESLKSKKRVNKPYYRTKERW